MKKELEYMILCNMLNEKDPDGCWGLYTREDGTLVFDGEIEGKHVQIPADMMLDMVKMKDKLNNDIVL